MKNNRREVSYEEGSEFARQHGIQFTEISAKTANNVNETFQKSSEMILDKVNTGKIDTTNDVIFSCFLNENRALVLDLLI